MNKCPGKHCNHVLDKYGDHLASCMKSGRVKKRAKCLEVTWAQICEEAGGAVVRNAKLRDMKLRIDHRDRRHVEFAVFGLPFWGGIPLLCDVTQGSPLKVDGSPHPKACTVPGGAIERGEKRKPQQYREAWQARGRVRLLTLACETGGRWSDQCVDFVRMLAKHKAKEAPPILQRSAEYGWQSRWWTLLSCSAHRTFAASITELDTKLMQPSTGPAPTLADGCEFWRLEAAGPEFSRLPLRA